MNIVVRTGLHSLPRTGRSHRLLNISRRDIYNGLRPIGKRFLIGNGHPRDGNRCLVAVDPMTVDTRHP